MARLWVARRRAAYRTRRPARTYTRSVLAHALGDGMMSPLLVVWVILAASSSELPSPLRYHARILHEQPLAAAASTAFATAAIGDCLAQLVWASGVYSAVEAFIPSEMGMPTAALAAMATMSSAQPLPGVDPELGWQRTLRFAGIVGALVGVAGESWFRRLLRPFPGWTYDVALRTTFDQVRMLARSAARARAGPNAPSPEIDSDASLPNPAPVPYATAGTIRTRGPLSRGRRYDLHREWRRRPLYTPQTAPRLRASALNHVDLVAQRHLLQLSHGANALAAGVCDELGHRLDRPRVFTRTPPNRRRAPAVRSHRLYRNLPARGASARRLIFVLR